MAKTLRISLWSLLTVSLLAAGTVLVAGCLFSAPGYQGARSTNFDGDKFKNQQAGGNKGFFKFLKWRLTREPGQWGDFRHEEPGPRPADRVGSGTIRVTPVNHSTVLIQVDGINLLTDPIWSDRASPVSLAGPHRVRPPGIRFDDLPPIDAVLISHNHYAHMDLPTLQRLAKEHDPVVFAGLGNQKYLKSKGIDRAIDLNWWEGVRFRHELRIIFVPARHFSSRGLFDFNKTLWGGFVIQGESGTIYFAGDTGWGSHFAQIRDRLGPIDLALLPVGAYRPRWFMSPVHISPQEAVRAHQVLGARRALAIHYGTFALGDDGEREPIETLRIALGEAGLSPDDFWAPAFGRGMDLPGQPDVRQASNLNP